MSRTQLAHTWLTGEQLLPSLQQELRPNRLVPSLGIGLTTGAVGVLFNLSFAALIFSGNLSSHLPVGIGLVLLSAAVSRVITALSSSMPGAVADLGTVTTAILAWSAGSVSKSLPASASSTEVLVTVIAAIALTSLLTGTFLLLLGTLRMGDLVRSVPYPVIGGFVASTGWMLVNGAFKVMIDRPLNLTELSPLLQANALVEWVPGLVLAVYLLMVSRKRAHPFVVPASLFASVGLFYSLLYLVGTSPAQASTQGWTLGSVAAHAEWHLLSVTDLFKVHWSAIAHQMTCMVTIAIVTAISLLLNLSSLELVEDQEINVNRELKVAGAANLVVGLGGGILTYHSLSKSVLAQKMGGKTRLVTLMTAGVFILMPLFGSSLIAYFPKAILGGLLLFLGLSLLVEWLYDAWFKLSKADYLVVQLILIVSGTIGFLQGLTLGWFVAVLLFVVAYSRINTIQPGRSGSEFQSLVERSPRERQVLKDEGDQLYILQLECPSLRNANCR